MSVEGGLIVLAPSAARTVAFTGDEVNVKGIRRLAIQLDVTAASGTAPTLDVKVQTTIDGTNWFDIAAFAQVTAVARRVIRIRTDDTPSTPEEAETDGTLAAGTVRQGPIGEKIRVKHALPGGTTPSFTWSCKATAGE